jgi:uncharacterized protein YjbI with pentapeptide repeats
MNTCRYEDTRNRFRCPEGAGGGSPWCYWHDPERPKSREAVEEAVAGKRNLTGAWLEGVDLAGADLENVCLYGAVLRFAKLDGARLSRSDLRYADLTRASLGEAELADALLEGANLSGATLRKAAVRYANLARARLREADLTEADALSAQFTGADLSGSSLALASAGLADFAQADLSRARLEAADLSGANLTSADLRGADLRGARLDRATRLLGVKYDRRTLFSHIDTTPLDPGQYPVLLRDMRDAQFLAEYERRHPRLYRLWKISSDCGRSLRRWGLAYLAAGLFFGTARSLLRAEEGPVGGAFSSYIDAFTRLLTLGASGGAAGGASVRVLLLTESAAAYALFAGFLSILFHKFARRG